MADLNWLFSQFLNNNYREEPQTSYVETQPDAGVPQRIQIFTDAYKFASGSIDLTDFEKSSLENFYYETTAAGSRTFNFNDCINGITRTARFQGKPTFSRVSSRWVSTFTLVMNPAYITNEQYLLTDTGLCLLNESDEPLIVDIEYRV